MFGKNQAREKSIQTQQLQQPLQTHDHVKEHTFETVKKITLREVPVKIQYGKGEYISFSQFAASAITHGEKLFTRRFALQAYAALFDAAVISGSNNPFSYRAEMCLWIKNKIDTLIVADYEKIQEFVAYLKKFQMTIKQLDVRSEHQIKFLMTLKKLLSETIHFVTKRCPLLVEKLSDEIIEKMVLVLPENPVDLPKSELIGRVGRDDFVLTDVKDNTTLFSAAFAECIYKKLIDMSQQCGSTRMLYRYDVCIEIKELIEKAKVDWDSYRTIIVKIPSEIRAANGVSGTEHFIAALSAILKDVVDYVSMVHPELEKSRQDYLKKLLEESAALRNDLGLNVTDISNEQ